MWLSIPFVYIYCLHHVLCLKSFVLSKIKGTRPNQKIRTFCTLALKNTPKHLWLWWKRHYYYASRVVSLHIFICFRTPYLTHTKQFSRINHQLRTQLILECPCPHFWLSPRKFVQSSGFSASSQQIITANQRLGRSRDFIFGDF